MDSNQKLIISCVAKSLVRNENDITPKTKIIADLNADSLDFMDIIFQLESAFDIKLSKDDFDFITSSGLKREELIAKDVLSADDLNLLRKWLPDVPVNGKISAKNLPEYVTIESLALVIENIKNKK